MKEITLYVTEINNVTTKLVGEMPDNLEFILLHIRAVLKEYPEYLFVRFFYRGSYYQVNNKHYVQL